MKRFIQFNDETIDSFLMMELSDIAKTLTRNPETEVEYGPHSYLDKKAGTIYISHFWDHRPREDQRYGLISDVFLRAIGNYQSTDDKETIKYIQKAEKTSIPSFTKQLFMLAEDLRIEEQCKKSRPGTKRAFGVRRRIYRQYFRTQLNVNLVKSLYTDALFNTIYVLLNAESPLEDAPKMSEAIDLAMPYIKQMLERLYESNSTAETAKICLELVDVLDEVLERDMLNEYFHLPKIEEDSLEEGVTFDDLRRKDPLANQDVLEEEKTGEEEIIDEEFRTWHRETGEMGKTFLQFDLDQGSQTDLLGEGVREGEAGDQALAMVQGSAKKTSRNDYSQLEAMEQKKGRGSEGEEAPYGKENRFAYPVFKPADLPSIEDRKRYADYKATVAVYQKKLKNMIEKTLEHKKIQPRTDLHFGRLNRKLVRFFLEDQPRMFYKKQQPSPEIDAVFSLLVDCSASMYDKMDQTKLGITLFHEALKSVRVPHEVTGFWEDTNEASESKQPNYLQTVIDYPSSLKPGSGPEIMQLQPEEDNRDGFAIRLITERLRARSEKQKFLLVFSDGEPAAFGYDKNGIIDTHEAVVAARKQGIEVINVFLANGEIDEGQKKIIQNIYGKYSILVSEIEQLPDVLFPLLRKLLYTSI